MNPQEYTPNYSQPLHNGQPSSTYYNTDPMSTNGNPSGMNDKGDGKVDLRGPKWFDDEHDHHHKKPFWKSYKSLFIAWAIIIAIVEAGLYFNLDKFVIGNVVFLFGLLSYAFTGLISLLGLVPFAGPFIIKVLGIPFVWLLNGVGYLVSLVAIRRGYSKDVMTYRGYTIALIIGITIGYMIGKLI